MKINHFFINSDEEVIVKIAKEVLALFKIEVRKNFADLEETLYDSISVENEAIHEGCLRVISKIVFNHLVLGEQVIIKENAARLDEARPTAMRRLIKLNIYEALREVLGAKPAPWGILHGVRPTKIVHKYIEQRQPSSEIVARLQEDYRVQRDKAELITALAFRQLPFLSNADPKTVSVYVGIPFCLSRCLYCSFTSYVLPHEALLHQFLAVLKKDILAAQSVIEQHGLKVQHIYIGGGTPTSLPNREFAEFLTWVKAAFYRPETVEFTVEAGRPDSVSDDKIQVMLDCLVNRVSVNPQTMQEKTLKHIGRNHTTGDIIDLFDKFRKSGMKNINMDLIIGLPGEGVAEIEDTMRQIVRLNPDDITLHALALKKGSSLKLNLEHYRLPDDATAAEMFDTAMRYVEALGMVPYYLYRQGYMSGNLENIGFSKPKAEGLYNIQIMEEQQTIIGIGPAATTKVICAKDLPMETSFHAKDLTTYLNDVDKYIEKRTYLLNKAFKESVLP